MLGAFHNVIIYRLMHKYLIITASESIKQSYEVHTENEFASLKSNSKGNIKDPYYCPFVRRIHLWLVDSPDKGTVMWNVFSIRKSQVYIYGKRV